MFGIGAMLADPIPNAAKDAIGQGLSTLAQTILGAICVVCIGITVLAVWKLLKVQEKAADRAEKATQLMADATNNMTKAFTTFEGTIDQLIDTQKADQQLQREQMSLLQQMKNSIDTIIRDAVLSLRMRSGSPVPSTTPPRPEGGGRR